MHTYARLALALNLRTFNQMESNMRISCSTHIPATEWFPPAVFNLLLTQVRRKSRIRIGSIHMYSPCTSHKIHHIYFNIYVAPVLSNTRVGLCHATGSPVDEAGAIQSHGGRWATKRRFPTNHLESVWLCMDFIWISMFETSVWSTKCFCIPRFLSLLWLPSLWLSFEPCELPLLW